MINPFRIVMASLAGLACLVISATGVRAGGGGCAHCGCYEACHKTCRLVCEDKKVPVTCWGCKTEDFCVPGPSTPGCEHCDTVCDECSNDPKAPYSQAKRFIWTEWIPGGCAKVVTKKKLMKKTVTKTVPSYKWVVEDLCPECEARCQTVQVPAGTAIPPAPVGIAKLQQN